MSASKKTMNAQLIKELLEWNFHQTDFYTEDSDARKVFDNYRKFSFHYAVI